MSLRRSLLAVVLVLLALVLAALLYLAFGDLSRHKPRIEAFISERTGRAFRIEGPFELEVLPAVSVVAENVRFENAAWGSQQPMVDIGRLATVIDLWSIVSGPMEIRSIELDDVAVLLEKDEDGNANWILRDAAELEEEKEPTDAAVKELPVVIEDGRLSQLRVTYREPGKADRVAAFNNFTVAPGSGELLAVAADGKLNEYAMAVQGEIGPVDALAAGRDIRMAVQASIGNLGLNVKGSLGRLYPLDGADLRLELVNPDVGTMLENLQLPVAAEGPMQATAKLSDAGERTGLDIDATLGDIKATVSGTLTALGLVGSDLEFSMTVGDAARLAAVFGLEDVPQQELRLGGRMKTSQNQIGLEGFKVQLPGAQATLDGTVPRSNIGASTLRFEAELDNIARLRTGLPEIPAAAAGTYTGNRQGFEIEELRLRLDETELTGQVAVERGGRRRIEARISSPRLDLTPLQKNKSQESGGSGATGKDAKGTEKYVFRDSPLPLGKLNARDAQLQWSFTELTLNAGTLKDVTGSLQLDDGRMSLDFRAGGAVQGTIEGDVRVLPSQRGADMTIKLNLRDLRAGLLAPPGEGSGKSPPTNVDLDVTASGASPRQMASGANGRIVFTQGNGHVKKGVFGVLGSDILNQLGSQLNPFSAEDPYTKLECTVAKIKIVDGQATVDPVLMQSDKVTVTADGKIDLRTEEIAFDFNTRPRKGIGISPGMFTNPFIQLAGTLKSPRVATGAKGVAAGALAVGTGGLSVVAKGFVDRVAGQADLCEKTLAEVGGAAAAN